MLTKAMNERVTQESVKLKEWEGIAPAKRLWGVDTGGLRDGETSMSDGQER
jgi:hypothetical protein